MNGCAHGVAALALAGILLAAGSEQANGQTRMETGFLNRTVETEGAVYRYQVYVPADYDAAKRWPVILFLHGAGERGTDGLVQTQVGLAPAIRADAKRYPAIVIMPQVPPDSMWGGAPARAAMLALDRTLAEFSADPDRVYLTGLSMGGNGTWSLAFRHPERFAAVAPICGWVTPFTQRWQGKHDVVPGNPEDAFDRLARKLAGVPVWIFHGEMDPVVPAEQSRKAAAALRAVTPQTQYTELAGTGHNSWDNAYGSAAFISWLFAQQRQNERR